MYNFTAGMSMTFFCLIPKDKLGHTLKAFNIFDDKMQFTYEFEKNPNLIFQIPQLSIKMII